MRTGVLLHSPQPLGLRTVKHCFHGQLISGAIRRTAPRVGDGLGYRDLHRYGVGTASTRGRPVRVVVPVCSGKRLSKAARQPGVEGLLTIASLTRSRLHRLPGFVLYTAAAGATSWLAHPYLLDFARTLLHLNPKDNVTAFQTSFFSFLSLIFAIYSGNTMAFLYDRQKSLMMNLYSETMALEELTEEAIHTLGPDARDVLAQIRIYIDTEIYSPENQSPPLGEGSPLALIRAKARNYRRAGTDVGDILGAAQTLAQKQNERQATAVRLLPAVHWALLYIIGGLFVCTFLLFETGGGFSDEGRHALFSVLCALMTFVLCALRDLADPTQGIYNTTNMLDARVTYVESLLETYQGDSARLLTTRPSFTNPIPQNQTAPSGGVTGLLGGSAPPAPVAEVPEADESTTAIGPSSSVDSIDLLGNRQSLFQAASSLIRRVGTIERADADAGKTDDGSEGEDGGPRGSQRDYQRSPSWGNGRSKRLRCGSDSPPEPASSLNGGSGSENGPSQPPPRDVCRPA